MTVVLICIIIYLICVWLYSAKCAAEQELVINKLKQELSLRTSERDMFNAWYKDEHANYKILMKELDQALGIV